ncbi:MAG: hypothetical protein RL757_485 [Bacteroidota bacterium]|jgi:hypothetical protein
MKNFLKSGLILGGSLLAMFLMPTDLAAQCAMCKGAAQTGLDPEHAGKSLNLGILMMFVMPYLLVGGIAFVWWKNKKSEQDADEEVEFERAVGDLS